MKIFKVLFVLAVIGFFMGVPVVIAGGGYSHGHSHDIIAKGGDGGDGGNAKIEEGAVKNYNTDVNVNKIDNTDVNVNKNIQGQKQGQVQGQGQGQKQALVFEQTFEDKRDHLVGPAILNSDPKLSKGKPFIVKSKGSVWDKVKGLSECQAIFIKKNLKDSDIKVKTAPLFEMKYRTKYIHKGSLGTYMGTLTIYPDGSDVTTAGMEASAALKAMYLGATHMDRVYKGSGEMAEGEAWNIGFGGGGSIMTNGDRVAIAPNGGMGFGEATAFNGILSEMIFDIYIDKTFISKENSEYKGQTGNHTKIGSIQ